ncbi:cytosine deaminase [Microbaculum marinum]|uniref:Cytosine deaminase n=1 Tax=Microbaculum marinum TaxID=1764581 RepID=A0AAW9RJT8_9HYPH
MPTGFAQVPSAGRYRIANAVVPAVLVETTAPLPAAGEGLVLMDIEVDGPGIAAIRAPGAGDPDRPCLDMNRGMVWPCFVDMHTHIDKGHIWPRRSNPDGTFMGALESVRTDREANWSAIDVTRRMDFSLRCAFAHGTALLRTHLDSIAPQHRISWPVFAEMRERWAGRIDLQAVSLFTLEEAADTAFLSEIADVVQHNRGVLGCVTYMDPELDRILDALMRAAADRGLDLDFHTDETQDPEARSLEHIAEAALRNGFRGRIVCGHCCSLSRQADDTARRIVDKVARAGLSIVSLPLCNMYLQDRHYGRTPRSRGITMLHELRASGVEVAVASDNTRDPFYAYGDLDMMEVFRESVRIGQLDHPIDAAPDLVAAAPARILGRPDRGVLRAGSPADLVLFRGRSWTELLARPQSDRTVLRNGRPIDTTAPDYRELDDLFPPPDGWRPE